MGFLGKVLVVVNAGISIIFLMWALAVYSEKIDWFTPASGPGGAKASPGVIEKAQAKIKDLSASNQGAAVRWGRSAYLVYEQEKERPQRRAFYRTMVEQVRSGNGADGKPVPNPARVLVPNQLTGLVEFTPSPNPIMARDTTPLESLAYYNQQIEETTTKIAATQKSIEKLIKEQEFLTGLIKGTADKKGLRTLISEQERILKDARLELAFVAPFWTSRFADNETVLKRINAMTARKAELEKFEEARGGGR